MTVWYEILIISAFTVSIVDFFVLIHLLNESEKPKKRDKKSKTDDYERHVHEMSERISAKEITEKDAQIFELRNRVAKLKQKNAVLEMEKEENDRCIDSWVNNYNELVYKNQDLRLQLKAKEQALVDLQKDYAELKEAQELAIMRPQRGTEE